MNYYRDKVAIVTGGASGIGRGICEELARRGAKVIIADINIGGAENVAKNIKLSGGWAKAVQLDVTKKEDFQKVVQETKSELGHLDFIFNSAGIVCIGEAKDIDIDEWINVIDVNLKGVIYGSITAYKIMVQQGYGHIVNIASAAGLFPLPFQGPYVASKFGVVGLSQTLRLEGAKLGVKVTVVCPGFVRTEMFRTAKFIKVDREKVLRLIPPFALTSVKRAVEYILKGVEQNKDIIVFPFSVQFLWYLHRMFPQITYTLADIFIRKFRKLKGED